jgi:hypothetical protein
MRSFVWVPRSTRVRGRYEAADAKLALAERPLLLASAPVLVEVAIAATGECMRRRRVVLSLTRRRALGWLGTDGSRSALVIPVLSAVLGRLLRAAELTATSDAQVGAAVPLSERVWRRGGDGARTRRTCPRGRLFVRWTR